MAPRTPLNNRARSLSITFFTLIASPTTVEIHNAMPITDGARKSRGSGA